MYREDSSRYKVFSRRAAILGGGQLVLFGMLAGRLYQLQVLESDRYRMLADENRINMRLLAPPRGRILDRFGKAMAVNRDNFRVLLIAEQTQDIDRTLDNLAQLIPISDDDRKRILHEMSKRRSFVPITVRENLDWSQVARIEVNAPDLPGVVIDVGQTREYPLGADVVHLIGYVAAVSEKEQTGDPLLELPGYRVGKAGIEKEYDLDLRGKAGNSQLEVNAVGRVIRELSRQEGQPGDDLKLTVDLDLQNFATDKLRGKVSAATVVLDVHDGAVLALSSVPGYDPNAFNIGISHAEWNAIVTDPHTPLINKAISGLYAPGSTFKVIVAMAALEAKVMAPDTTVYCRGFVDLGNARFHCWKHYGHGEMNMVSAIQQSCDVYFYEAAKRVGIDRIADMAKRFGLGAPTGIDLPGERGGLVPTAAWKKATTGIPWQKGETLVAGIGQGFVLATPLQLAVMAARIASGRSVTPYLVRSIKIGEVFRPVDHPAPPPVKVSRAALRVVIEGMNEVTNSLHGTAHHARIMEKGMEMAGKTGTSQVRRITRAERQSGILKNNERPWKDRDHALFVAFAPVAKPRYAVSVVVEHGGGGSAVAAPLARDILLETLHRDPSNDRGLAAAQAAAGDRRA